MKVSLRIKAILFFALLFTTVFSYALPFTIVPKAGTSLPTSWSPGQTLFAYYTVVNNTVSQRNNNFARYLPPGVQQVTSGGTYGDTCGASFNLGPNGSANDSCTLQLNISGIVNANDPDQTHHLFVCFPGGKTCAGTNFPLNISTSEAALASITVLPASPSVTVSSTLQLIAQGSFTDGTTQNISSSATWASSNPAVATVSNTGLVTGISAGTTSITATQNGITSAADIVTIIEKVVSITVTPASATLYGGNKQQMTATATYSDSSTGNVSNQVSWVSANPADATINSTGLLTVVNGLGNNAVNITANLQNVTSSPAVITTILSIYASCSQNGQGAAGLGICSINPTNGTPTSCFTVGNSTNGIRSPLTVAVNSDGSDMFAGSTTTSFTMGCTLSGNSPSNTCAYNNIGGNTGIAIDNANHAYLAQGSSVAYCTLNGTSVTCPGSQSGFGTVYELALNPAATLLYVPNSSGISYCRLSNGVIGTCTATTSRPGPLPFSIAIDAINGFAFIGTGFITNSTTGIFTCNLNATTGDLTNCTQTGSGVTVTGSSGGVVIDPSGKYLYFANLNGSGYVCTLNNTGTLTSSNCTSINLGGIVGACGSTGLAMK